MLKVWMASTATLLIQVFAFTVTWLHGAEFNEALTAAFIAAFMIFIISLVVLAVTLPYAFAALTIAFVALAAMLAALAAFVMPDDAATGVTVVFTATLSAVLAALSAKEEGAGEPVWVLFVAALPFGVGTLFGGLLFLRFKQKKMPEIVQHP